MDGSSTELEQQHAAAAELEIERKLAVDLAKAAREEAEATHQEARAAVREAERAVEAARRESARIGGELAAVNQFLRSHQSAPGGARSLADELTVAPGYELGGRCGARRAPRCCAAREPFARPVSCWTRPAATEAAF